MKKITTYILEKLKKINSKTEYVEDDIDTLKDRILNNGNTFNVLDYLMQYALMTNIVNKTSYKKLLGHNSFIDAERFMIYRDLKSALSVIAFDVDIIDALHYNNATVKRLLEKENKETLLKVLKMLSNYYLLENKNITWTIQHSIDKYFNEYEKN